MRKLTMEEWREEYDKIFEIIAELKDKKGTRKIIKALDKVLDEFDETEVERKEE